MLMGLMAVILPLHTEHMVYYQLPRLLQVVDLVELMVATLKVVQASTSNLI